MHFKIFDVNSKRLNKVLKLINIPKKPMIHELAMHQMKKNQFFFTFEKKALACGFL